MPFDGSDLLVRVMYLIPVLLSLTVHEFAHAWSAYRLGDDTAARMGRLTLNPISHIDPIGTLLLPLMGIPFGWAKPVPVNPTGFRRDVSMSTGMMITAAAGPISNLVLAVLCTILYGLLFRWIPGWMAQNEGIEVLLRIGIIVNVSLAIFNALPIPPLDGSRVLEGLLPSRFREGWQRLQTLAPLALLGLFIWGRDIIDGPSHAIRGILGQLAGWLSN